MSVKLSVCIVAFDNYDEIKEALLSIEEHTSPSLSKKIYIVDNGASISDSHSLKSFRKFISEIEDVEYINTGENLGFGKGHNVVLRKLDSQYHAIVNPDILLDEDVFSKIVEWMDKNPSVGMTIPYITDEDGNRQSVYRKELTILDMFIRFFCKNLFLKRQRKHTMQDMDYTRPFQVPFGQGSFLVINSELFKKLQGFDENFFMYVEDADLCKRVNDISRLMYYPGAKVIHKWKKESHRNAILFKYHIQSMKYYFKKWGIKFF